MPHWSNELPQQEKHMGFDLRRTPATSSLRAIITCDDILVCDTHFFHGRTSPCERPDCPACNDAIPYRTHVYVSAFNPKTMEHFIFECTSNAAKPFAEYKQTATTLRGCLFDASRPKGAKNSKVVISTATANLSRNPLPEPPNIMLALSVIWRLPLTGLAIEHDKHHSPKVQTKNDPINRMRSQPDNQPEPLSMREILSGNGKSSAHKVTP